MVSVTMSDAPPPVYNPSSGIIQFSVGSGSPKLGAQIEAYYAANFRQRQMETFAQFVLEKGRGAITPNGRRNKWGDKVSETWEDCGARLFGEKFIPVMAKALADYRSRHGAIDSTPPLPEPPAYLLEGIPDPDF